MALNLWYASSILVVFFFTKYLLWRLSWHQIAEKTFFCLQSILGQNFFQIAKTFFFFFFLSSIEFGDKILIAKAIQMRLVH